MHLRAGAIPKFLITGADGQVGFELRRSFAPLGEIIALDRAACDLSKPDVLRRLIRGHRPHVIINPAAYTAVDRAERDADVAFAVNGTAVGILAEEAQALSSLLVHYSTDHVFDGTKADAYVETDAVNPLSVYGRSKLAGERAIAATGATALVLRTSWVAGAHGDNFAKTMLRLGREQSNLRVISDHFGAPTTAGLIADVTAQIVAHHWLVADRSSFPGGVYHLAAGGDTTWYGYATEVLRYAAMRGVDLKVDISSIEAIPSSAYPQAAVRPANSRLNTHKLRKTFDLYLPDWQLGMHHLLDQLLS